MKKTLLCCLVLFLLVGCKGNSSSSSPVNSTSSPVTSTSEPNEYSKLDWSDQMVAVIYSFLPMTSLTKEMFLKYFSLLLFDSINNTYPEKRFYPSYYYSSENNNSYESLIILDKDYNLISIEEITANDLVSYFVSDDEKTLYVKLLENREYRDYKTEYEKSGKVFKEYSHQYDIDVKVDESSLPYFLLSDGSKVVININNYAPLPDLVEGKGEYWDSNNVIYDFKDYGYMHFCKIALY